MNINLKFYAMRNLIFLFFGMVFLACPGPGNEPEHDLLTITQFTFHQDVNQLYFGVFVEKESMGVELDSVKINWYGSSQSASPDLLTLFDDGTHGDILLNDGMYGLKIPNDSSSIANVIGNDSGLVFLDFIAYYGAETILLPDTFRVGNIIPRIISITALDTIVRSSDATVSLHLISAEVFDVDGIESIKWAGFTSYHVDGDSMTNNGNYLFLYDDGSTNILYPPDFTSGDLVAGDGIYSFRIPVYGSGFSDPNFQTKTGTFIWRFIAQDLSNDYSKVVEHEVVIQ
jgi:hypothetical protein